MSAVFPSEPMLARRQLRLAVLAALQAIPSVTVLSPGDWDTPTTVLPAILMRVGRERKESVAKTQPEFTTSCVVEIEARVEATTAESAQDSIESLGYAIENAVYQNYAVMGMVQQIALVDSETEITANGRRHLAGLKMSVTFEMFESFDPTETAPLLTTWPVIPVTTVPLTSVGIHADMDAPFDPNGTYTPSTDAPPYTPTPAPRTIGPDGRDEGALDIQLPQ